MASKCFVNCNVIAFDLKSAGLNTWAIYVHICPCIMGKEDIEGQLLTCAELRKIWSLLWKTMHWIGIPGVQILAPSLLLTLFISLTFSIIFLNTSVGGLKQMICMIFKPQILLAFSCPASDIHWHIMDPERMRKAAISIQSHISFTGGGHHMFIKAQPRVMHSI